MNMAHDVLHRRAGTERKREGVREKRAMAMCGIRMNVNIKTSTEATNEKSDKQKKLNVTVLLSFSFHNTKIYEKKTKHRIRKQKHFFFVGCAKEMKH